MGTTRRPSLALARPQTARLALPLRRAAAALAVAACAAGLLYVAARETSLFALRSVEVRGAPDELAARVEATLRRFHGTSLVALDTASVERALRALPAVRSAAVERDFPHTLDVSVTPERAVAVLRRGNEAWLVASGGKVLQAAEVADLPALPRIWVGGAEPPVPGELLHPDGLGAAVRTLVLVPGDFPARVASAAGTADEVTLVLANGMQLRVGDESDVRLKLEVAATVLRSLSRAERAELAYLDVSIPARPVGAQKSQVEGRG